jgi:hypothetical protein
MCLFTAHVGSGSSLLSCGVFLSPPLLQVFPLVVLAVCCCSCLLLTACCEGFPLPPLQCSGRPALFTMCLFCCYCLLFSFFSFFPGWGSVCPGDSADLAQGCLWEYRVPLSSPCGPRLPKPSGRWCLAAVWEPSWFLRLPWSGDAMRRLEVWRSQSFASSQYFFM